MCRYSIEAIRETDLDIGHEVPMIRATCAHCGLVETVNGTGLAAENRAVADLRARCEARIAGAQPGNTGSQQPTTRATTTSLAYQGRTSATPGDIQEYREVLANALRLQGLTLDQAASPTALTSPQRLGLKWAYDYTRGHAERAAWDRELRADPLPLGEFLAELRAMPGSD